MQTFKIWVEFRKISVGFVSKFLDSQVLKASFLDVFFFYM